MRIVPLKNIPLIGEEDDLGELILEATEAQDFTIEEGDVIVIAQSVVSKSEGNVIDLNDIWPSRRAEKLAEKIGKDPREAEMILQQTEEIIRSDHVLISRTKHGFICANAGVDASNAGPDHVTVLPDDPDKSAQKIRKTIKKFTDTEVAVIISDSWGRPFRLGAVGVAVGVAGMRALKDLRGREDAYGGKLETTVIAPVDSLAAVGALKMGEADERVPAVVIKNAPYEPGEGSISELFRPREEDLFRRSRC